MDGTEVHTGDVREACREMASLLALQCEREDIGGMSLRVGGACDLADTAGISEAGDIIADMGRWCSLIYTIYARLSAEVQMKAAERMGESSGLTIEELARGWVQPARVNTRAPLRAGKRG